MYALLNWIKVFNESGNIFKTVGGKSKSRNTNWTKCCLCQQKEGVKSPQANPAKRGDDSYLQEVGGRHKEGERQQTFDTGHLSSAGTRTHVSPVIDGDNSGNGLNSRARRAISGHRSEQPGEPVYVRVKGQCARGQSSFTIDTVGLTIQPSNTVPSGTPVTLSCQVTVSHDNIPNLTHTFQLRRDDVPIHSSTSTEDAIVYELDPARAADSGSYECRVTVKDKNKISVSKKLDVTGLQTPILYLNKTFPYESEEFTASCSAPEEKGSLIFRFYQRFRTGEIQKIKQPAPTGNSSETTLVLRRVGDSHLYCDYEVNLVSGARRSNRSNDILVIVKALYISPVMNVLPSPDVYEGDIIEVVCKVVSPLNNIDVFLTKDRRILKKARVSLSHRYRTREGDSGELVCKAEWGNVQKETYQTITVKELFSNPQLSVTPIDIFEGDRFKLTCPVSIYVPEKINNESVQFSFYKDNVKVASAETYVAVAHPSKNGNYTCKVEAASSTHSFVKESQMVVVKAKVPVSKPMLSVVGGTLVLGKRFQLLCHSNNGTLPIIYTLHSPDRQVELMVSKPGEQAIFNASAIYKTSDLNRLMCHAKNSENRPPMTGLGEQLLRSTIIEPVSKPVLSVLPDAGDVSEGQDVTLVCTVERGTLPINFTLYHTETQGALGSQTSKTLKVSYSISNIRGEQRGGYYCVATNRAEETKRSHTVMMAVKMAGWKKGLIAVIVICFLLILAMILIMAFKRRLLLFKRKRTGELSVKSASTKVERLSLTQAEVNEAANESEDQNSVTAPEKPPEPQYTEVQTRHADPDRAPVKKGTDTVYSEVRNSKQGVPEQTDGQGSVEYAQLNHDTDHHSDHGNQGDHIVQDDHIDEIDDSVHIDTADHGE
ncbi:platelet endothelial cell adhesion molecule isoform X3 [Sebastes umbrosus]|uniref:platelet endothelial cell adhesion molecule isoform X3 n=1 Tax=Sebastes umbrosus TaxID=72105 RepID=UPI00189ECE1D|nr:platelet endothelial cell adhesion molecule isoform X3 [Sebastes umbrosus]